MSVAMANSENESMVSPLIQRKRRRRRPTMASTASLALLLSSTAAMAQEGNSNIEAPQQQQQHNHDQRSLQRRLREQTAVTLTKWRSLQQQSPGYDLTNLRPLDLVLDETDVTHQRVYQKGDGGFLEPYDLENYQKGFVGSINVGGVGGEDSSAFSRGDEHNVHHASSGRLGFTNFDLHRGIGVENVNYDEDTERRTQGSQGLRGLAVEIPSSSSPFFKYTEENDPEELEDYEIIDDSDLLLQPSFEDRRLQSHHRKSNTNPNPSPSHHSKSSAAHGFANNEPSSTNQQEDDIIALKKDTDAPIIRATFPPIGVSIGERQTFGALVNDNGGVVKKVCLQFKDHVKSRSDCFRLQNVGADNNNNASVDGGAMNVRGGRKKNKGNGGDNNSDGSGSQQSDIWELSFEGFAPYAGKEWEYRIKSTDGSRNKKSTKWRTFRIDERAAAEGGGQTKSSTTTAATEASSATAASGGAADKLMEEVTDENWPHGGVVQSSTGRILFFFDSHPYVCTGTVLRSPAASDRTVILTAGHCAYQHRESSSGGGRFAEHALFIPNQVDTRGARSNEVCKDDPLGCWIPAFAVVHYEWTTKGFPKSVPWDYAYYVIPNLKEAHEGGFIHEDQKELSKILEEIVEPLPVDFEWQLHSGEEMHLDDVPGEFTHGLGYSFNKDPAFRFCAAPMSKNFGIDTYENLWLETCEMTGGSSGGPWMMDVDSEGRGTVVSVNSWGYGSSPGMGGPNFATEAGSKAECLFERAMGARFEDVVDKGIVVDDCP